MKLPRYEYATEGDYKIFKFTSEGPKGNITKLVVYTETTKENVYNLAFGDYDEESGNIDDKSITDNKDSRKVLATVASTLYVFTEKNADAWVYATGSNHARTRLYRMGITLNLEEVLEDFEVFGLKENVWLEFEKGADYEAFLVKRRTN